VNKSSTWGVIAYTVLIALLWTASPRPAHAFDDDHLETINGTRLHFRVRGTDKAHPYLLLLHGGPGFSSAMFYPWGPRLENRVNVVYLDQRGSGPSARLHFSNLHVPTLFEAELFMVSQQIADIEGVRRALHIDKWYVLGHSWGGMLGLEYVSAHPEHARGYVLVDGLVSVPAMTQNILDNAQAKFTQGKQTNQPGMGALLAQTAHLRALPQDNPERLLGAFSLALGPAGLYFAHDQAQAFVALDARITEAVRPYGISRADRTPVQEPTQALMVADHFLTRDDTPLLAKISTPTLIIQGQQDGVVSPQSANLAHQAIKNSQLVLLDQCGQFPFAEQPDKSAGAVLAFVSKTSRSADAHVMPSIPQMPTNVDLSDIARPCVVSFVVTADGQITSTAIKQLSGSKEFDQACLAAIKNAQGVPAVQNGAPHSARCESTFRTDRG